MKPKDIFFSSQIEPGILYLGEDESRHCSRVLRKNTGDLVQVIDGKGMLYEGTLELESKNKPVKVWINSKTYFEAGQYQSGFHLGLAATKNADRMEWLLEKTVELGINSISFLQCEHSERSNLRLDRLEKIAISALKQSKQYWLPQLEIGVPFSKFIQSIENTSNAFIAHCYDDSKSEFSNLVKPEPCTILIGPEGDFSLTEVETAKQKGIITVALGNSRLRTETAGLYACAVYRGILLQ